MADKTHIVLVVEDDDVYREDIHRLIDGSFKIIDAVTGGEALNRIGSREVHCVLLDYRLPDLDGLQLLPELIEARLPVVMLTAEGSEQVAVEAMKLGAYDYLIKNTLTADSLRTAIAKAIERTALERKVWEQQQELKMFASIVSHDLKAPLRTIDGFVKIMIENIEASNTEEMLDMGRRVIRGVSRMGRLIDGLLNYAHVGRSDRSFQSVDLNEVADDVVGGLRATIENLVGRVEIEDLPQVHGDRVALTQLLQNLIANGLKFHRGDTSPSVRITASQVGDCWHVSVEDNGIGVDPQYTDEIFQPLRRLHNDYEYEGSGLGLAVCKRIVDQHGGHIWVESQRGQGSTFYFTIPVLGHPASKSSQEQAA